MQKIISIIFLIVGLFFVIHFTFLTTEVLHLLDYAALLYCGVLSFFVSKVLWSSK